MKKTLLCLDVSTTCTGISVVEMDDTGYKIMEITYLKLSNKNEDKLAELLDKTQVFQDFLRQRLKLYKFDSVLVEEPLLQSNNIYTAATLLRFNGMISKVIRDEYNISPKFISSYESRMYAFPDLMSVRKENKKGEVILEKKWGKPVLFGAYPFDVDKKKVIWEKINNIEPNINWEYNKKGDLKKENYDSSDSFCLFLAAYNMMKLGIIKLW